MAFLNKKFEEIPCDGRIKTDEFLLCCDEIVKFFDSMGTVFRPVKSDVEGNIKKIRQRLLENPCKFGTLPDIIDTELEEKNKKFKVGDNEGIATNALMWLQRGLKYIYVFFVHFLAEDYVTPTNDRNLLKNCALMAYTETLKTYHGFMVGKVFSIAMHAAPYRNEFLKTIACRKDNDKDKETLETIADFNISFEKTIRHVEALLIEKNVVKNYKV